jgi:hypothetical protein
MRNEDIGTGTNDELSNRIRETDARVRDFIEVLGFQWISLK